ncbi:hypothetical protein N8I77_003049 [Diaporthe amygdali]|uniref:AAA+ ATPase domain-containing protein n=1 Tax=Phomopsis amygdali TaxID=1214568 RepID=A0AAD9SI05_PHOAM|nr:hypothetical protein N8I77_003049 [Diaporthe amygdali]
MRHGWTCEVQYTDFLFQTEHTSNTCCSSNYSHSASAPEQDRPGALSTGGTQHDNDRSEITGIHVLPTYGEITAQTGQYLPAADPASWHLPGARGRLDREFRLLREDTAGQIRDGCREILKAIHGPGLEAYRRQRTTTNFDFCDDVKVQHVSMHNQNGIQFTVAFKQPEPVRAMEYDQRQAWWERCKRFRPGTLVSVLDTAGVILHFVVSESTLRGAAGAAGQPFADSNYFNLSSDNEWSYANLMLVESSKLSDALRWYDDAQPPRYLLDFPDLLLASFKPTLEALQQLSQSPGHHLLSLLDPDVPDSNGGPVIEPPAYAQTPEFTFNLGCLTQEGHAFQFDPSHAPTAAEISLLANLPPDQAEALLKALSSEIALIYGRPGTGKSYLARAIIRTLLYNKDSAGLGPTICVFHNDAALDRMVEQLFDDGVDGIVRMGGRSTSERLQNLDLLVTSYAGICRQERHTEKQIDKFSKTLAEEIKQELQQFSRMGSPFELHRFLSRSKSDYCDLLFGRRHGDFSNYRPDLADAVRQWLAIDTSPMEYGYQHTERQRLHQNWLKDMREDMIEVLARSYEEYEDIRSELPRFHDDCRRQILQGAQVIAVTTTELANNPQLLQPLQAKVLVFDEADEFLESQILTAILPSIEHIILLGDYRQLLPKVQTKKLQRANQADGLKALDISLFERLVDPPYHHGVKFPFSSLRTQNRMHPTLARLTVPNEQPVMDEKALIAAFPPVIGMRQQCERSVQDDDSCINYFEVEMATAIVSHIIRQGHYSSQDIAVITPSSGQLRQLQRRMKTEHSFTTRVDCRDLEGLWEFDPQEHEGTGEYAGSVFNGHDESKIAASSLKSVRLAILENFRGEEAKIVIISLVRSNPQRSSGILQNPDRINTLMSRAQHGCYILGDSSTYKGVPTWGRIINMMQTDGNLGDSLELQCPRHTNETICVSNPDEFSMASADGGCSRPCGKLLQCGHDCHHSCHSEDMHEGTKCIHPCPRPKSGCGHSCPLSCGDRCEDDCSARQNAARRYHVATFVNVIVMNATFATRTPSSGHTMSYVIRHAAGAISTALMPVSGSVTETPIADSVSSHATFAAVILGAIGFATRLVYRALRIIALPAAPTASVICLVPRHATGFPASSACPSLCGEVCPDSKYCQTCGAEDILLTVVDSSGLKEYRDIDLNDDPCVFPACGHFQTRSSMDRQFEIQEHFNLTEDGTPLSIKGVLRPFSIQKVACCARCRGSLRDISRYGRILRRQMLDNVLKEFTSWSDRRFLELNEQLAEEVTNLQQGTDYQWLPMSSDQHSVLIELNSSLKSQIEVLRNSLGQGRYAGLVDFCSKIEIYLKEVKAKGEVFQKVANLMKQANDSNEAARCSIGPALHEPLVHPRGYILAMDLYLRCNITTLADLFKLWMGTHSTGVRVCTRTKIHGNVTSNLRCSLELIRCAKETDRQIIQAQGHLYFAWYCGFARGFGEDMPTRGGTRPAIRAHGSVLTVSGSAVTYNVLKANALEHIRKARSIHDSCTCKTKSKLPSALSSKVASTYNAVARNSRGTGLWRACDNGHPFRGSRSASMFLGQLRCTECGSIVPDTDYVSDEGAPRGLEETLPSQAKRLVDI